MVDHFHGNSGAPIPIDRENKAQTYVCERCGRIERGQKRKYICALCGTEGHDRRTCDLRHGLKAKGIYRCVLCAAMVWDTDRMDHMIRTHSVPDVFKKCG